MRLEASRRKVKAKSKTKKTAFDFDYELGFWLDNNTFIKADDAELKLVERKEPSVHEIKQVPMVIFRNAVEIWVNDSDKIVGVINHKEFGLWLDAINDALKKIRKNPPVAKAT